MRPPLGSLGSPLHPPRASSHSLPASSCRHPLPGPCRAPLACLQVAYCTSQNAYLDGRRPQFEVPYDVLVVSVGERPATFGTPGVEEHCFFLKEVRERGTC